MCVCGGGGGGLNQWSKYLFANYLPFTHLYFHENNITIRILGFVEAFHYSLVD